MKKRGELITILFAFIILVPFAFAFSGVGDGTVGNPYNITNCTQLQEMNLSLSSTYQLVNNINCSDTVNWGIVGFIPVGINASIGLNFSGNFNGNNYNISDLYINNSTRDYAGLFGYAKGEIKDVNLIGVNITGKDYVGAVVGYFTGDNISNCNSTGNIIGVGYVGGIVGSFGGNNILNSFSSSTIIGTGDKVGGIAGYLSDGGNITNSYATGNITGAGSVGGIAGEGEGGGGIKVNITDSYATGNVTGTGDSVGGLIGLYTGDIFISSSYATGNVIGVGYVGGLVGYFLGVSGALITDSYATGNVTGTEDYIGGLVGRFEYNDGTIENSYATGNVVGDSSVGGLAGVFGGENISNSSATGQVTGIGNSVGGLVGEFDTGADYLLDSYATGNVTGVDSVGGLVGTFSSGELISNSYATGKVIGTGDYVGGLVGDSYSGGQSISNSYATGDVNGTGDYTGGLVGDCVGDYLSNSYATGNVTGAGDYVGGLAGEFLGLTLNSSYSTGNVTGEADVGGLVGYFNAESLLDSYASGNITGNSNVGGLVGNFDVGYLISNSYATGDVFLYESAAGGLVGLFKGDSISNSYATGDVTSLADFSLVTSGGKTGGLVGEFNSGITSNISNCYSEGDINATYTYAGGLVAYFDAGNIFSSYALGDVNGTELVGGLVGATYGISNISNSYSRGDVFSAGNYTGGFIGDSHGAKISDSYSTGNVISGGYSGYYSSGGNYVGGFAGAIYGNTLIGTVSRSYSVGNVSGVNYTGQFAGSLIPGLDRVVLEQIQFYNSSESQDCYYGGNENCTAISTDSYFYNYENSPMNLSLGTGWNFTTWDDVYNGTDYPVLVWQGITIPDLTAPTYSYATENLNTTLAGELVLFSSLWDDETALNNNGQYIFSTNNTGTWANDTSVNFTTTPSWANVTKTLNTTGGKVIGYRWYAKDNAGNWNETGMNTLTTSELDEEDDEKTPINYSSPKINPVNISQPEQDIELRFGDKIKIINESVNYILRLDKFNSSEAKLKLDNSTNNNHSYRVIILPLGKEYSLDLNLDSKSDLILIYQGISAISRKAMISTRAVDSILKEEIPVQESKKSPQQNTPKVNLTLFWIVLIILFIILMVFFFISNKKRKKLGFEDRIKVKIKKK